MKRFLTTTAIVVATATAAQAGSVAPPVVEPPVVVAPMPAPTSWTGFYVGGLGGYTTGATDDLTVVPTVTSTFNGLRFGGFAGYNYQMGSGFVLGAELAGSYGNMTYAVPPNLNMGLVDAKAKLGFATGDVLIYATGGYSMAFYSNGDRGAGWNAGAGVDVMVTDSLFVGGEVLYRDITDSLVSPAAWEDKFTTISARVGWKF